MSLKLKFIKHTEDAVIPTRAHPEDIGYDLTTTGVFKINAIGCDGVLSVLFETGISVQPPSGYYVEIIPRSSLTSTGYVMPNSVGVIDPTYTGTLKIPAMKVDKSVPDLCPPFTKFQLVMRPAILFEMEETKEFGETVRGSGGFGSSG